jgi:hypothetical protein
VISLYQFLSGGLFMGLITAGLFFLRFWTKTRDRLFLVFSLAFFAMGLERLVILVLSIDAEEHSMVYLIRLVAFLMFLIGIVDKNRASKDVR